MMDDSFSGNEPSPVAPKKQHHKPPRNADSPVFGKTPTEKGKNTKGNPIFVEEDAFGSKKKPTGGNRLNFQENDPNLNLPADEDEAVLVLKDKIRAANSIIDKQDEEHKQQVLHVETITMMTKYQLVFIKMETSLVRLSCIMKNRENMNMLGAFKAMRLYKNFVNNAMRYKASLVANLLEDRVKKFVRTMSDVKNNAVRKVFTSLYTAAKTSKKLADTHRTMAKQLEDLNDRTRRREQDILSSTRKVDEFNKILMGYQNREAELSRSIKLKERQISSLENEITTLNRVGGKRTVGGSGGVEARLIEQQIRQLESENHEMRERISMADGNVSSFIKEMSDLLDSHELSTIAGSEDNNNSVNYNHHQQHNNNNYYGNEAEEEELINKYQKSGGNRNVGGNKPTMGFKAMPNQQQQLRASQQQQVNKRNYP